MLFPSLESIESEEQIIPPSGGLNVTFSTEEYLISTFLKKIQEGSISDPGLEFEIGNHISKYCDYDGFKNPDTRKIYQALWTNERFLSMFFRIISEHKNIKDYVKRFYNISVCKIAYDYYFEIGSENLKKNKPDPIAKLFIDIVRVLNIDSILPLTTTMQEIHAIFIVMSRYSSFNMEKCIKRVNEFIMRLGYDFSAKNIIDIYSYLYESFSIVFNVTMTQIYDLSTLDNLELSNYYHMNTAILIIVNSMTSYDIFKVLNGYANYVALFNKETRFDIKTITDYDRIIPIMNQLMNDGVIFR